MAPSLAVLSQYFYAKKKFLACSSTIKQACLPVWEAAVFLPPLVRQEVKGLSKLLLQKKILTFSFFGRFLK